MSDDATPTTEPTEAAPTAPAEAAPSTPVSDDGGSKDQWSDADLDKAYSQTVSGESEPEPTAEPGADSASPVPTEETPAEPTPPIGKEDAALLGRFKLNPETIAALPEASRTEFLANLKQRAAYDDGMGPRLAEMERRLAAQQQAQPQAPPIDDVKPWQDVAGEEAGKSLHALHQQSLQRATAPLVQQNEQLMHALGSQGRMIQDLHTQAGFTEAKSIMPEGVDLTKADAREKVISKAWDLLKLKAQEPGFDLTQFNLSHAIPQAALLVFPKEIKTADAKAAAEKRQRSLRGTPHPGTRNPTVAPRQTEEERLDAAYDALQKGGVRAAEAAFAG